MKKRKFLIWLLPIAAAVMIFCFSAQPAQESSELSNGVVLKIIDFLTKVSGSADAQTLLSALSTPVRKAAHITEYLIFDVTLLIAWFVSGLRRGKMIGFSMLTVFLYACTDEFHQIFVDGRAGRFTDVLIDCSGAAVLAVILLVRLQIKQNRGGSKI